MARGGASPSFRPPQAAPEELLPPSEASEAALPSGSSAQRLQLRLGIGGGVAAGRAELPLHGWVANNRQRTHQQEDGAVDLSGWRLRGTLNYTLPPGTVGLPKAPEPSSTAGASIKPLR